MHINIVALEENHKLLNCPGKVQNNEIFSPVLNKLSFGFREKGQQILLLSHGENCIVMELQADENETIDIFTAVNFLLSNFANKNKIDTETAFSIIDTLFNAKSELPTERTIYPLFPLLGWLPSKKGEDAYRAFPNFSNKLRSLLQNKKVALAEAFLFHLHLSTFSYDNILDILPANLSFSETNLSLKMAAEIIQPQKTSCTKKDTPLFSEMLKILSLTDNKNDFLNTLHSFRYPYVSQIKKRFSDYISAFNFPNGVSFTTDEFFEKNFVNMSISFNDKKSLEKKLTQTLAQLKTQEDSPDYFCIKKLWEEECTL